MDDIHTIEKMFSEMGLDNDSSRKSLTDKMNFDFDFTKNPNQCQAEIITTTNTKNEKLCPTGTK